MEITLLRALPYFALVAVIIANVLGNIFMKLGSSVDPKHASLFGIFGWQTLLGLCFFASGVLFYGLALKTVPLYAAQSVVALQFVGIVFCAAILFGETISPYQWLGIVLMLTGLTLVTRQI